MSDFMQECIQDFLRRIATGVELGDRNPSITKFAHTLPTFRFRQSKRPIPKPVLQEFPLSNGFQFPQIHTSISSQLFRAASESSASSGGFMTSCP